MTDLTLSRLRPMVMSVCAALALSACATAPTDPVQRAVYDEANDPLEPMNRVFFEGTQVVDKALLRPLAIVYNAVLPDVVREGISNVLSNMGEPVVMANNLLQGEVSRAAFTLGRFLVNSTIGAAGVGDVASNIGLPEQPGDFGQTLHVWGMEEGPYLFLPLLGPSNPRDAIGFGADRAMSPWGYIVGAYGTDEQYWAFSGSSLVTSIVSGRAGVLEEMDNLERTSVDFYAQLRSVYRQYRNKQLGITPKMAEMPTEQEMNPTMMAPVGR
ncbi:MAG: VacJ family lipoprotein [Alphaproteobacteria bacterium]|nr:MAG: VacJ family lipoprotein [Alphaproteobacteria bacterium]